MIGVCVLLTWVRPATAQQIFAQAAPPEANPTVAYALTILVVALVMLLVCMPARRE
jgi:hypothetical protein